MRDVAIVSPLRTAVGRFGGGLKSVAAADLGAAVIRAVLEKTSLDPGRIDDVVLGHGYANGEEPAIGRLCALKAGLPIEVPGSFMRCSAPRRIRSCMGSTASLATERRAARHSARGMGSLEDPRYSCT